MGLIYIMKSGTVVCSDAGCEGCEHTTPHEYDSCDTSCDGDGHCPECIKIEEYKKVKAQVPEGVEKDETVIGKP